MFVYLISTKKLYSEELWSDL